MIKNSREYDLTNSIINQFNERKKFLQNQERTEEIIYEIDGINAISEDLKQQLYWYEAAKNSDIAFNKIELLEDIPKVIIGKRIQLNIPQNEFADRLGIDTEDYIRLENEDFYGVTPELLKKILFVLNVDNPNHIY